MRIKVSDSYDFINNEQCLALNQELGSNINWSYVASSRVLTIILPDSVDTSFLDKYGDILSDIPSFKG